MGVWQVDGLNILLSCWQKPLSVNYVQHCIVWWRPFWVKKPDEVLCCWRLHRSPCLLPISTPNMLKQSSARETGCLKPRLLETCVQLKDATLYSSAPLWVLLCCAALCLAHHVLMFLLIYPPFVIALILDHCTGFLHAEQSSCRVEQVHLFIYV